MLIGYCGDKEVMYWHNQVWVRGTDVRIFGAGVLREAIERAKRNLRNFVAIEY